MINDEQNQRENAVQLAKGDALFLRELVQLLWQKKWLIVSLILACVIGSGIWVKGQPDVYRATVLLAPAENRESGLTGSIQSLGGLAGLAGVGLPSTNSQKQTRLALEVLKSRTFIMNFIERHALLPDLVAVIDWDKVSQEVRYDDSLYDHQSGKWSEEALLEHPRLLSLQDAYYRMLNHLVINEESGGWVTLQIEHISPQIAKQWLLWLVNDLNATIKDIEVQEAHRSIAYLNEQIEQTALTELRFMFYELIQAKTETVMLAKSRPEYVFRIIDPPIAPEEPHGPKRALVISIFGVIGFLLAIVSILGNRYLRL